MTCIEWPYEEEEEEEEQEVPEYPRKLRTYADRKRSIEAYRKLMGDGVWERIRAVLEKKKEE